jgi:hypothetical protein
MNLLHPKNGQNLAKTDLFGIAKPWNKVRACLNYDDTQGFLGSQETNSNGLQPSKWPLYNPWDSLGTCEKIILHQPRVDQNSQKQSILKECLLNQTVCGEQCAMTLD